MPDDKPQILVVDDDRLLVTMLSDMLAADFHVLTAHDGDEALAILAKEAVAAVLSDQNMPKVSGVAVLQNCLDLQPKAVRILVTATDSVRDIADATNVARVHRVVVKPVRELEIPGIVKGAIREAQLEEENARLVSELQDAVAELQDRERELEHELQLRNEELRMVMSRIKRDE